MIFKSQVTLQWFAHGDKEKRRWSWDGDKEVAGEDCHRQNEHKLILKIVFLHTQESLYSA